MAELTSYICNKCYRSVVYLDILEYLSRGWTGSSRFPTLYMLYTSNLLSHLNFTTSVKSLKSQKRKRIKRTKHFITMTFDTNPLSIYSFNIIEYWTMNYLFLSWYVMKNNYNNIIKIGELQIRFFHYILTCIHLE